MQIQTSVADGPGGLVADDAVGAQPARSREAAHEHPADDQPLLHACCGSCAHAARGSCLGLARHAFPAAFARSLPASQGWGEG
jgi:hypothetical protein